MIKTILPNCRWLSIKSEHQGRDWSILTQKIDQELENLGMDLSEETIFLIFDETAGHCQVARSVIGPKKILNGEIKLVDWVQAPVLGLALKSLAWDDLWAETTQALKMQKGSKKGFMLAIKRRLNPELALSVELLVPV